LIDLDISLNQVKSLPDGIGNSTLTRLKVAMNQLSELPSDIFDGVLIDLDISFNQLKVLPDGIGNGALGDIKFLCVDILWYDL